MFGTIVKLFVALMAVAGLSAFLTRYAPMVWTKGFQIPVVQINMTYAVAILLVLFLVILGKLKWSK